VRESRCDHCTNMLHPCIVTVVDLYQNCLCFKLFHNIFISFVVKVCVFYGFPTYFYLCCCDFDFAFFFLMSQFHCHVVGSVCLMCYIFIIWFTSGLWKILELD